MKNTHANVEHNFKLTTIKLYYLTLINEKYVQMSRFYL